MISIIKPLPSARQGFCHVGRGFVMPMNETPSHCEEAESACGNPMGVSTGQLLRYDLRGIASPKGSQ
jgi:hypothetical protein